jgi:hypothetical protein
MDDPGKPATDFTAQDQAFFAEGEHLVDEAIDSFDDLDEGRERRSFWDRLRRR